MSSENRMRRPSASVFSVTYEDTDFRPLLGVSAYRSFCNGFDWKNMAANAVPRGARHWAALPPRSSSIPSARRPRLTTPIAAAASAGAAVAPDLDLLVGSHRTYTHSIGAVALVGVARRGWSCARRHAERDAVAGMLTAAYGSHLVLDWLSKDTATPSGSDGTVALLARVTTCRGWNCSAKFRDGTGCPEEFIVGNLEAR